MTTQMTARTSSSLASGAVTAADQPRRRDALCARLLAAWLDGRIARGADPGSARLVAARAAQLEAPRARRSLAEAWDQLLERSTEPPGLIDPRVPVARADVQAAAAEITDLVALLRSPAPVAARDVARATALLTDGRGPVYQPGRGLHRAVAGLVTDLGRGVH